MVMSYLVLATDYDGTLATEGEVESETLAALERWRAADRKLVLITGRRLDDWLSFFSYPHLFDWVVAENGAVLYQPPSQQVMLLAAPPPVAFIERLRDRISAGSQMDGASDSGEFQHLLQRNELVPVSVGRVIVATWQPYDQATIEVIQELGLDLQVILNKGAVMVLPNGVDKASGLQAVLQQLNVTPEQTVGVGDAENDSSFLDLCGFSVAVANALPSLKAQVDWVTPSSRGAGVVELISRLL